MANTVKIKVNRNLSCAEYRGYDDVEIYYPSHASSDATLIIEVLTDGELQGVIPCNKDLMIGNIPTIATKYKQVFINGFKGISRFRQDQHKGRDVYKLETDTSPETVCEFIKGIYDGVFEIETWNAIEFCVLADYLQCSAIRDDIKNYINNNMCSDFLVEAWAFSDWFEEGCLKFVRGGSYDVTNCLWNIGSLEVDKFIKFVNAASDHISSEDIIKLKLRWCQKQGNTPDIKRMITETDFNKISEKDRIIFFKSVMQYLGNDTLEYTNKIFGVVEFDSTTITLRIKFNKEDKPDVSYTEPGKILKVTLKKSQSFKVLKDTLIKYDSYFRAFDKRVSRYVEMFEYKINAQTSNWTAKTLRQLQAAENKGFREGKRMGITVPESAAVDTTKKRIQRKEKYSLHFVYNGKRIDDLDTLISDKRLNLEDDFGIDVRELVAPDM